MFGLTFGVLVESLSVLFIQTFDHLGSFLTFKLSSVSTMSRLGQLRSLKKASDVFIGRGRVLNRNKNQILVVEGQRAFSALTPILYCKSPDGAGPSPPPTSGNSGNQKGKKIRQNTGSFAPRSCFVNKVSRLFYCFRRKSTKLSKMWSSLRSGQRFCVCQPFYQMRKVFPLFCCDERGR